MIGLGTLINSVSIIAVMTSSLGKGAIFSAIPVFVFEGAITLLARLVSPIMTPTAEAYLSLIGSVLIFCIGINLVWGKKLKVATCCRRCCWQFSRFICRGAFRKINCVSGGDLP